MEQLSETLRLIMCIIGIIQFLSFIATWYFGVQVKMLRMELMSKDACDKRHQRVKDNIEEIRHHVGIIETKVDTHLHTKD